MIFLVAIALADGRDAQPPLAMMRKGAFKEKETEKEKERTIVIMKKNEEKGRFFN